MPYQRLTKAQRAERDRIWLERHLMGQPYDVIASDSGVTATRVCQAVQRLMSQRVETSVDEARRKLIAQCEMVIDAMAPRAKAGDAQCTAQLLRAIDQRAKLMGAYAPTAAQVEHTYTSGSIDDELARLAAELGVNDANSSSPTSRKAADQGKGK